MNDMCDVKAIIKMEKNELLKSAFDIYFKLKTIARRQTGKRDSVETNKSSECRHTRQIEFFF